MIIEVILNYDNNLRLETRTDCGIFFVCTKGIWRQADIKNVSDLTSSTTIKKKIPTFSEVLQNCAYA